MGGEGGVKEGSLSALGSSLHSSGQREAGALGPWCEKTGKWRGVGGQHGTELPGARGGHDTGLPRLQVAVGPAGQVEGWHKVLKASPSSRDRHGWRRLRWETGEGSGQRKGHGGWAVGTRSLSP